MTIGEFKELCEEWEIEDDAKLEFGIDQKTHEVGSFFFVNNTVIFEKVEESSSENSEDRHVAKPTQKGNENQ